MAKTRCLNIVFMNRNNMLEDEEISSQLSDDQKKKLENFKDGDSLVIPIDMEKIIFIFAIVRDEDVDCEAIFTPMRALRHLLKTTNTKLSDFDDYDITVDQLENVVSYLSPSAIGMLMDMLIDKN